MMLRYMALIAPLLWTVNAGPSLMDTAGNLRLSSDTLPPSSVTIVTSPGTPSVLLKETPSDILTVSGDKLVCRGATLSGTSDAERTSLATCSLIANVIVLEGITSGDIEASLQDSRHARTLTALFRARLLQQKSKQTLILVVEGDSLDEAALKNDVAELFKAVALEKKGAGKFEDLYDLRVELVGSAADASKVLSSIKAPPLEEPLASSLTNAYNLVKESGLGSVGLDTPLMAQAFVDVGTVFTKQVRTVRAKFSAWKGRAARGLLVDGFGRQAQELRHRALAAFENETLNASGLPTVSAYRLEMRARLQNIIDEGIEEIYYDLVTNLEKMVMKRFNSQMLKTLSDPVESMMESNNAALRKETFSVETIMEDLEVPVLGLSKDKGTRAMTTKLNDALTTFPDSAAAKIKRKKKVSTVVNKQKKPGQKGIDLGIDLVAMLRPDGFGSLQGFAGYQLGGNSITFGIHNDADDPQVIAQFGGVRPPLLRVQPKLRVDVEM